MTDDLVKRLRMWAQECAEQHGPGMWSQDMLAAAEMLGELDKRVHRAKIVFATMRSEMSSVCAVMEAFEND